MREPSAGLQHERTTLAWERTSIAMMVAGVALARYGAIDGQLFIGGVGIVQTAAGGALLVWAGTNDDRLHNFHDPAMPDSAVPQVALARVVGAAMVAFRGFALTAAVLRALFG